MSLRMFCDGCDDELREQGQPWRPKAVDLVISGCRANGMRGCHPIPNGDFSWCQRCASIAFRAVEDAKLTRAGWSKG